MLHAVAEAEVVSWLGDCCALGVAPDEVEVRGEFDAPAEWGVGRVLAFAFRLRPPHEAAPRGWMLAVVGPYPEPADPTVRGGRFAVHSTFEPVDADDLPAQVLAAVDDMAAGRRRRE